MVLLNNLREFKIVDVNAFLVPTVGTLCLLAVIKYKLRRQGCGQHIQVPLQLYDVRHSGTEPV